MDHYTSQFHDDVAVINFQKTKSQKRTPSRSPGREREGEREERGVEYGLSTPPMVQFQPTAAPSQRIPTVTATTTTSPQLHRHTTPGLPTPPTPATPAPRTVPPPSTSTTTTRKKHVSAACSNCRAAHAACDNVRPCERCIRLGKEDTCMTPVHRKRGRKSGKGVEKGTGKKGGKKEKERQGRGESGSPKGREMGVKVWYDDSVATHPSSHVPYSQIPSQSIPSHSTSGTPGSTPILPHSLPPSRCPPPPITFTHQQSIDAPMAADTPSNSHQHLHYHPLPPQAPLLTASTFSFPQACDREERDDGDVTTRTRTLSPLPPPASFPYSNSYSTSPSSPPQALSLPHLHPEDFPRQSQKRTREDVEREDGSDNSEVLWHVDLKTLRILNDGRHIYHLIHPIDHPAFTSLLPSRSSTPFSPSSTSPPTTSKTVRIHIASPTTNTQSLKSVTLLSHTHLVAMFSVRDFWVGENVSVTQLQPVRDVLKMMCGRGSGRKRQRLLDLGRVEGEVRG